MPVVTISRQYASGGSHIARLVADRLAWPLVDNEFVDRVAERAGLPPSEVAEREERVPGLVERLARALAISSPEVFVATGEPPEAHLDRDHELLRVTEAVIAQAVQDGSVVLVGRGAQAVLANRADALHAYIVAPREARIEAAMQRLGVSRPEAEDGLDRCDSGRRRYVKMHYARAWDDAANYDLVLNSTALGYDGCADLIVAVTRMRGWCEHAP